MSIELSIVFKPFWKNFHKNIFIFNFILDIKCKKCGIKLTPKYNRPVTSEFGKYLSYFLHDNPDENCAKAGHAAYGSAVNYYSNETSTMIKASYFMTYHTLLKTSSDYYEAMRAARLIGTNAF